MTSFIAPRLSRPAVSFLSYQNYLFNKIGYINRQDMDIWTLQQTTLDELYNDITKILDGNRFPYLLQFFIVVDKTALPYRAYYFTRSDSKTRYFFQKPERLPQSVIIRNKNELEDAETTGCFECHASGPLRLRPRRWDTIPELTDNDWQLVRAMNERIATYGAVTTDLPGTSKPITTAEREPLMAEACRGCHATDSIRAPILRFHSKIVVALMNAHERPDGYFEYSIPAPNAFLMPNNMQTRLPSISQRHPAAMPPLMPLTASENERLFQWIGKIKQD